MIQQTHAMSRELKDQPAVLGGKATFSPGIPFAQPTLPDYSRMEEGFKDIFRSGMVTKGKFLSQLEKEIAEYLGVPYAKGVVNCTMGLYMLIKALDLKGEVIVPSFSFSATFHVVEMAGIEPVFADCQQGTWTLSPESVEKNITDKTSAIMATCIFGNPPDIENLQKLADKYNLKFILDSAHSLGTIYNGKPMGGYGDGEVFSTSATKLLATGEGGILTTRSREIADFIQVFREYGNPGDYDCIYPGINGRMSELHALLGLKILPDVEEFAIKRNRLVSIYKENLDIPGISFQKIRENARSSYKDFVILIDEKEFGLNRDQLASALKEEGIPTRKYFHPPGHTQKCYKKYAHRYTQGLKNTDYIAKRTLVLPLFSHMKEEMPILIAESIRRIHNHREEIRNLTL